ncbi:hypothetical protein [Streptomyces phytophilus]|uniref:hypothetical protein n=1 Tax=Streptomyces phytophilus TaxID=722715 RepID=UPI0015F0D78F|nr:hypothetical protein [Streptomyces phytophilus]
MLDPARHAKDLLDALIAVAGDGLHVLTLSSATGPGGPPLIIRFLVIKRGAITTLEKDALSGAVAVLAGAVYSPEGGSVVLRTVTSPVTDTVRTWRIDAGKALPLTADETRAAYCTDAATGEPLPSQPGVTYADAPHLDL